MNVRKEPAFLELTTRKIVEHAVDGGPLVRIKQGVWTRAAAGTVFRMRVLDANDSDADVDLVIRPGVRSAGGPAQIEQLLRPHLSVDLHTVAPEFSWDARTRALGTIGQLRGKLVMCFHVDVLVRR